MNVKRYLAKDEQEALQKIRQELGRDAVILHTRKIKQKGIRGWFSKPLVEVVAAVEAQEKPSYRATSPGKTAYSNSEHNDYLREATQALLMERARALEKNQALEKQTQRESTDEVGPKDATRYKPNDAISYIPKDDNSDLNELKAQIASLTQIVNQVVHKIDAVSHADSNTKGIDQDTKAESEHENEVFDHLSKQMIDTTFIERIKNLALKQTISESGEDGLQVVVKRMIREMIGAPYRIEKSVEGPQIYCFVGPTGVGKTTTLAKIAAKLSLVEGRKVGLITSDTYRISAVDQLKTYSEILNVPLEVIYEPEELPGVISRFGDKDFILIDTAGRNHKSSELKSDLTELLKSIPEAEVFLVISLTTSSADIESILNSYSFIGKYELILTKLDEAASYGNILNTRLRSNQLIAFLTNGQSVPDDITVADGDRIASLLVGD